MKGRFFRRAFRPKSKGKNPLPYMLAAITISLGGNYLYTEYKFQELNKIHKVEESRGHNISEAPIKIKKFDNGSLLLEPPANYCSCFKKTPPKAAPIYCPALGEACDDESRVNCENLYRDYTC